MRRRSAILLASCSCFLAVPAIAQTDAGPAAPVQTDAPPADTAEPASSDIVVTAQRRTERVQDVPIAISVVSGDQLDRQQVTQLSDLSRTTASLQINSSGGGAAGGAAFIRGIGTAALTRSAESAVGIVVDGVVQGNTNISNLFDVARVEVLRGPQGTLFGQSVSAGVVNITTQAPDPSKVSGKLITQLSFDGFAGSKFGKQNIRGGVNVPINDTSAVRVSMYAARTNGVTYNTFRGKDDELIEAGWRARYRGEFGDRVTVNLIADYGYNRGEDGQFFTLTDVVGPEQQQLQTVCGIDARPGNLKQCGSAIDRQLSRTYGASGQIDVELGSLSLTSITSRRFQDSTVNTDIDRLPNNAALLNVQSGVFSGYRQFTQEVRLASDASNPLSFTLGGFYLDADTAVESGPSRGQATILPNGLVVGTAEANQTDLRNLSAFGEARFHSGPFTVFAGGRITDAKIQQDGTRQNVSPAITPLLVSDITYNDTDFSWRAGAQFEVSRSLMFYGTAARGYKNAQIAPISIINNTAILGTVVLPEKPMAYEAGVKTTMFDGRLAVNVDGFYQKVRDFQAQTAFRDPVTQVPSIRPINIDRIITKGIEGDIFGRIGRHLTLNASAIYNVARYPDDFLARDGTALGGEQIAYAPRFSATFSGEYTVPLSGTVDGFVSANINHRSRTRLTDERSEEALTTDKSRWIFGGQIGARVNDAWSLALFANNIGDSRYTNAIAGLAAQPGTTYAFARSYNINSLRQVGLQLDLQF